MKIFLTTAFISITVLGFSQDPSFTHYRNNETYINPAWTPDDSSDFVTLKYRNQWPSLNANSVTSALTYSHYHAKTNGNTYASFMTELAGGFFQTNRVSAGYVQKLSFGDFHVQPAIELTYQQKSISWDRLTFGDLINPTTGFIYNTADSIIGSVNHSFDVSAGIMTSYKNFWLGGSFHHINQPNQSLVNTLYSLPIKLGVQLGYKHQINQNWELEPFALYARQSGFQRLQLGANIKYKMIQIGIGGIQRDALYGQLGFVGDIFEIHYSYDRSWVGLENYLSAGSHELSARFKFWHKTPHKNYYDF